MSLLDANSVLAVQNEGTHTIPELIDIGMCEYNCLGFDCISLFKLFVLFTGLPKNVGITFTKFRPAK